MEAIAPEVVEQAVPEPEAERTMPHGLSMVVFSGELDKALAAFIIADGAAAMDLPVTMFFTFWGLNILRREGPVTLKNPKNNVERLFGYMMPKGAQELKLSRLNMGGLGTRMIRKIMGQKHVMDLPQLLRTAQEQGVRLVACTMSMDLMGIRKEELIPGLSFGGVGSFIDAADGSSITLFI